MVISTGILYEIKELSEKSRQLLAKGPAYQNDIKDVYLYPGVAGTTQQQITITFLNTTTNINPSSCHYTFYGVEEKKIRDCKIWSPYDQFVGRSLMFTNLRDRPQQYVVALNEYRNKVTREFRYHRYMFNLTLHIEIETCFLYLTRKTTITLGQVKITTL